MSAYTIVLRSNPGIYTIPNSSPYITSVSPPNRWTKVSFVRDIQPDRVSYTSTVGNLGNTIHNLHVVCDSQGRYRIDPSILTGGGQYKFWGYECQQMLNLNGTMIIIQACVVQNMSAAKINNFIGYSGSSVVNETAHYAVLHPYDDGLYYTYSPVCFPTQGDNTSL
jgi:hypothetical protein